MISRLRSAWRRADRSAPTAHKSCAQLPGFRVTKSFIVRDDVELLPLADPFAQLVGFADIFGGTGGLSQIAVFVPSRA